MIDKFSPKRQELEDLYKLAKEEIMQEREHACEGCGTYSKNISFSHRIPRSRNISMLHDKGNIDMYCMDCHDLWERGQWRRLINGPHAMRWLNANDPELYGIKTELYPGKEFGEIRNISPKEVIEGNFRVDIRVKPLSPAHTMITGIGSIDSHAIHHDTGNVYNYAEFLRRNKSKDQGIREILNKIYLTVKKGNDIDIVWWYNTNPSYGDVVRVLIYNALNK